MSVLTEAVQQFIEKASRPGVLGAAGHQLEVRAQQDMKAYFKALAERIDAQNLGQLAEGYSKLSARSAALTRINRVLYLLTPVLKQILELNLQHAYSVGWRQIEAQEAEDLSGSEYEQLAQVGQDALLFARFRAGELVTGIDETTRQLLADAIETGIDEGLGVDATGRLIRQTVMDMTVARGKMIATTEMNSAMSQAALKKMNTLGIEYKQIILAPDACDICATNADADPIPADDSYDSGDDAPPFHPNCRCAIVPARAPETTSIQ